MITIETAKQRLEIVRLRNLASWQAGEYAASFERQAAQPIYPGQEMVCLGKADQARRLAAENEARADLLEAECNEAIEAIDREGSHAGYNL